MPARAVETLALLACSVTLSPTPFGILLQHCLQRRETASEGPPLFSGG
jgi:hypothetical protein